MPHPRKWKCEQLHRNVFTISIDFRRAKDQEAWYLLTSDQHWDNPDSNHKLQIKHLEEAKERNAGVMSCADFFCAMQGKYDKRANKSKVRPEHQRDDYLDALIETSVEFFKPYSKLFHVIGMGNHEQAIMDRHETNLIERFCGAINHATGSRIKSGGFSGWLIFKFWDGKGAGRKNKRIVLHYDHGYGGGGPVTDDMIQHQRRAVYLPDADIVISGHTHGSFIREMARVRLDTERGGIRHDIQTHIKIPSYKDEYKDGYGGWATASKGMPPKPIGAWWLRFYWDGARETVGYDVIRAQ